MICTSCPRTARPGKKTCLRCATHRIDKDRKRHELRCNRCKKHPKEPGVQWCTDCVMDPKWIESRIQYTPLDEVLSSAAVRIARILRHCEWLSQTEIGEAVGVDGTHEKNAFSVALARMVKLGQVDRTKQIDRIFTGLANGYWYRLNQSGRDWLESRLRSVDMEVATDEEIAEHDAALPQWGRSAA